MRVVVVGAGAVGARAGRQLLAMERLEDLVVVDPDVERRDAVVASLGPPARAESGELGAMLEGIDVVLLAAGVPHAPFAEEALRAGASVVSTSDAVADVEALLALDDAARSAGRTVVAGAGFSPGLTCALAAFGARSFEHVDEVHVAKTGTGGPACARQHHRALQGPAREWQSGGWRQRSGGSGRELAWFPDPLRAVDCYRAALADPLLLVPAFPGVRRVTARMGASRRDRLTSAVPMLRKPHPEGGLGAVRVELLGTQGPSGTNRVLGAVDRPSVAAGAVAALAVRWAAEGRFTRTGAGGLASLAEPSPFLATLAERGVKVAVFEGGHQRSEVTSAS